jgi:hypothetical protein
MSVTRNGREDLKSGTGVGLFQWFLCICGGAESGQYCFVQGGEKEYPRRVFNVSRFFECARKVEKREEITEDRKKCLIHPKS